MKIKEAAEAVRLLLKKYPELRDDDNRLLANFWFAEIGHQNFPVQMFLHSLAAGEITPAETVRRTRQKLQEECPELRGKKYMLRHEVASQVRAEISGLNLTELNNAVKR